MDKIESIIDSAVHAAFAAMGLSVGDNMLAAESLADYLYIAFADEIREQNKES